MILSLFVFVVFTMGHFVLACLALYFHLFSFLFSIMITSLGEERAGLCASRSFVCLFCTRQFMSFFSSSWCQRLAAACDCGTPLTFPLTFLYSVHHAGNIALKTSRHLFLSDTLSGL